MFTDYVSLQVHARVYFLCIITILSSDALCLITVAARGTAIDLKH
jgi:hypothetical protein